MSLGARLFALIALGTAIRLVVVYTTDGTLYDIESYAQVYEALKAEKLGAYGVLDPTRWPYPPGYMPWVAVAGELRELVPFERGIRFGSVLADAAIALVVQDLIRRAGGDERRRLVGAGLIALGPLFVGVAGFNGQVDPAATLPALLAYWVWTRPGQRHRGLAAGALLGVGGAIKTVPLVLALPFAAAARDVREGAAVLVGAGAVMAAAILPFFVATPGMLDTITNYQGVPGWGGIGLLVEPTYAAHFLSGELRFDPAVVDFLRGTLPKLLLLPALAGLAVLLLWRRPDVLTGICVTYLVVYVFGVNLFISYLVWWLPFLVVRGHFAAVAAVQLCLAPAQVTVFAAPVGFAWAIVVYSLAMALAWVVAAGTLGGWTARLARA